jgi:hypothetical protein
MQTVARSWWPVAGAPTPWAKRCPSTGVGALAAGRTRGGSECSNTHHWEEEARDGVGAR